MGVMSESNALVDQSKEYRCKICGLDFVTAQLLAAHIDSEHLEAEQPEILQHRPHRRC
jgi:hypothetical protein